MAGDPELLLFADVVEGVGAPVTDPEPEPDVGVAVLALPDEPGIVKGPAVGVLLTGPSVAMAPSPPRCGPVSVIFREQVSLLPGEPVCNHLTVCSLLPIALAAATNSALLPEPLEGALIDLWQPC